MGSVTYSDGKVKITGTPWTELSGKQLETETGAENTERC